MTNHKRPSHSFQKILALSAGLSMAGGALCMPSAAHAGPFSKAAPTATGAAPTKSKLIRNVVIGGVLAASAYGGFGVVHTANTLKVDRESVRAEFSAVDVALASRSELIPNLVATAKGYGKLESDTYVKIAEATAALKRVNKGDIQGQIVAGNQLTAALQPIIMMQANFPELKAEKQFSALVDQLKSSQAGIDVARTRYNRAVTKFNQEVVQFPTSTIAGFVGVEKMPFFEAPAEARNTPVVSF